MELKELLNSNKKLTKERLLSLPEKQVDDLIKDILNLVNNYKTKYKNEFVIRDFIENNYTALLKNRFIDIKKKFGELNYDILNKDKIIRDLKRKIDDKTSIRKVLREIAEKYNITDYDLAIESIPLIIDVKNEKKLIEFKKTRLFDDFENIYDKIILTLNLTVDKELKYECFNFFLAIWNQQKKGTKYRAPKKLSPIIVFMFFKKRGLNLNIKDITKNIDLSNKEIKQGLKEIIKIYPEYLKKNRRVLVQNKLEQVQNKFKFPKEFTNNSKAILEKFWPYMSNTTEGVAAGTVCVLTMIAMDIKEYNFSQICSNIGITQSAVIYQIKNKIFERLHISGFQSIIKSRLLIKDLIMNNVIIKI